MRIRVLVADDEPHARLRVKKIIEERDDGVLVGDCKNGKEAIETILNQEPDLVFLDIRMPDMTGFEVLNVIGKDKIPHIIFTTAFDRYAIKAFDINAVDYLLKPIDLDRFNESIDRVKETLKLKEAYSLKENIMNLLEKHEKRLKEDSFIIELRHNGRNIKINFEDIYYFEATGNYVKMILRDKNYLYRSSMTETEEMLGDMPILRIHRSFILNTNYVREVRYLNNSEYDFLLKNGEKLKSGRTYRDSIVEFLNSSNY